MNLSPAFKERGREREGGRDRVKRGRREREERGRGRGGGGGREGAVPGTGRIGGLSAERLAVVIVQHVLLEHPRHAQGPQHLQSKVIFHFLLTFGDQVETVDLI